MRERINAGPIGKHIDTMRPSVVRNLVYQQGLGESAGAIRAQDELAAYWQGAGVEKVMVEEAVCTRCQKPMTQMTCKALVGPKGINEHTESGHLEASRVQQFPFVVPKTMAEAGAHCDCGGRLRLTTRPLTTKEDW